MDVRLKGTKKPLHHYDAAAMYVSFGNVGVVPLWLVGHRLYNSILGEPFKRIHGIIIQNGKKKIRK